MRRQVFLATVFVAILGVSSVAEAQASRTWVSGVGDDANPCSRTAPCKTFAGAISKTAPGGYIDALDPGGFGAVTITKSITIDGGGFLAGILAAGTTGIIVNAAATDKVILRHLSIEGFGTGFIGIRAINSTGRVHVEDCIVSGFTSRAISYESSSGALYVNNTLVTENQGPGILVVSGLGTLDNVRAQANSVGIKAASGAHLTVRNTVASANNVGFLAEGAGTRLDLENSITNYNNNGISGTGGSTTLVSNTSILDNATNGLLNDGASFFISFLNNRLLGNGTNGSFTSTTSQQ